MQTETAGKRPRTASREVRRQQLIEATIASIAEHGISGTTMATVTGRAKLSMGIVSFHFQSKENLFKETLTYLAEEHRACWLRALETCDQSPVGKLVAITEAHFDPQVCSTERIAVWFAFFGEMRYRKTYREKVTRFDRERQKLTEAFCAELARAEEPGLDPAAIAEAIESFADGLWLNIMMYPECLTPESAREHLRDYLTWTFPNSFAAELAEPCRSVG
ncbi:MAG: TetR family transcriptional regulator C-terminal domain-containing protein [Pseudomonadota bacterium]